MSLTYKQKAVRRLKSHRQVLKYDPRPGPSSFAGFTDSPLLYYQVYDSDLAPVRKGVTYAHSLEELSYMALDNAHRLGTFDELFEYRPNFSTRSMTIRDLILTSFVGTSDGKIETMLVCPYQGESPFDLDTSLFATVASDLVPNTRDTPLRIALNVPAAMRKWSGMAKLSRFSKSGSDKLLHELNNRVNIGQIVELRNDPEGSVKYSQKVLDQIQAAKNPPPPPAPVAQKVAPENTEAISDGAQAGTALEAQSTAEAGEEVVEEEEDSSAPAVYDVSGISEQDPAVPTEEKEGDEVPAGENTRAPIAIATEDILVDSPTQELDVSAISGPLSAAKHEDNTIVEPDAMAVDANESNPVFSQLENTQYGGEGARMGTETGSGSFTNTKALLAVPSSGTETTTEEEDDADAVVPSLEHET